MFNLLIASNIITYLVQDQVKEPSYCFAKYYNSTCISIWNKLNLKDFPKKDDVFSLHRRNVMRNIAGGLNNTNPNKLQILLRNFLTSCETRNTQPQTYFYFAKMYSTVFADPWKSLIGLIDLSSTYINSPLQLKHYFNTTYFNWTQKFNTLIGRCTLKCHFFEKVLRKLPISTLEKTLYSIRNENGSIIVDPPNMPLYNYSYYTNAHVTKNYKSYLHMVTYHLGYTDVDINEIFELEKSISLIEYDFKRSKFGRYNPSNDITLIEALLKSLVSSSLSEPLLPTDYLRALDNLLNTMLETSRKFEILNKYLMLGALREHSYLISREAEAKNDVCPYLRGCNVLSTSQHYCNLAAADYVPDIIQHLHEAQSNTVNFEQNDIMVKIQEVAVNDIRNSHLLNSTPELVKELERKVRLLRLNAIYVNGEEEDLEKRYTNVTIEPLNYLKNVWNLHQLRMKRNIGYRPIDNNIKMNQMEEIEYGLGLLSPQIYRKDRDIVNYAGFGNAVAREIAKYELRLVIAHIKKHSKKSLLEERLRNRLACFYKRYMVFVDKPISPAVQIEYLADHQGFIWAYKAWLKHRHSLNQTTTGIKIDRFLRAYVSPYCTLASAIDQFDSITSPYLKGYQRVYGAIKNFKPFENLHCKSDDAEGCVEKEIKNYNNHTAQLTKPPILKSWREIPKTPDAISRLDPRFRRMPKGWNERN